MADNEKDPTKLKKVTKELKKVTTGLDNLSTTATSFFDNFGESLDLSIGSIIKFALKIDEARAEMSKATGGAEDLGAAMSASREHIQGLAIRYEELSKHVTTAYQNIAIFSEASKKSQGIMLGAAAGLEKLGVEAGTTAQNINSLTKGLGMTGEEASKVTMDLAKVAKSLGSFMTPDKIAKEFSKALPLLAAYGKGAVGEFNKLAGQAKATGMEMQGLLGVAGKFDTFEDAANTTAQLNALMGTQLNSVDLLTASEGERIEMLKQSVEASGKNWDSMDRFEKKALAGAVGMTDLNEAGKLFGTSMEDMQEAQEAADPALVAQEELNAAMKRGVSLTDAWKAMLEGIKIKLGKKIMPHVMDFFNWLTGVDPKDKKSPIDHMVDAITDFAGLVEVHLIEPFGVFWKELDKEDKQWVARIAGIVLALGPIIGFLGTIGGAVMTVVGVFGSLVGVISGVVGVALSLGGTILGVMGAVVAAIVSSPVATAVAVAAVAMIIYQHWGKIKAFVEEYIIQPFNKIPEILDSLAEKFPRTFAFIKTSFEGLINWLGSAAATVGNFFIDTLMNKGIIASLNESMSNIWGALPDIFINALPEGMDTAPQIPEIETLHEGGSLVGPAKIRNDEYVIIPPANSPPGEVLTPQQAANNSQQPIEMVINIDGREFVRQTVMPTLNKQFNLQGIG